jgi:hypothetical protein
MEAEETHHNSNTSDQIQAQGLHSPEKIILTNEHGQDNEYKIKIIPSKPTVSSFLRQKPPSYRPS